MQLFNHVFDKVTPRVEDKMTPAMEKMDGKSSKQISAINYEVGRREAMLREKKKGYHPLIDLMDSVRTNEHLTDEIQKTMVKKKWRGLDMCFKWRLIETYLNTQGITLNKDNTIQLKSAVRRNSLLNVEYDAVTQRIDKLNYHCDGTVL